MFNELLSLYVRDKNALEMFITIPATLTVNKAYLLKKNISFFGVIYVVTEWSLKAGSHSDISISTNLNIGIRKGRNMCESGLPKHKHKEWNFFNFLCLCLYYVTPVPTNFFMLMSKCKPALNHKDP